MKNRVLLIGLLILGLSLFPVFYNILVIRSRIYYFIHYDVNLPNDEEIITNIENFNYTAYLNDYIETHERFKSYVDKDLILFLKCQIKNDTGFHWVMSYEHHLHYYFLAENHSELYLTYNNDTIFTVKDKDNNSLNLIERYPWAHIAWYLNFTLIPYVYTENSTLLLEDIILVKIDLDYGYLCGNLCAFSYHIFQYLILNESLDVLLIVIPEPLTSVA